MENNIPPAQPQQDNPPQSENKPQNRSMLWIKAFTILLAISTISAFVIIMRGSDTRKMQDSEDDIVSGVGSMLSSPKEGIAIVQVRGVIEESNSSSPWEKSGSKTARRIRALGERKEVKGIIIDINSPGGSVAAVQEIFDEIKYVRTEQKKPVVALLRDVAASGGYYIAAGCDKIIAQPGTLTGSIGVIMGTGNMEELLKKIGVRMTPVKSGSAKDIGSPYREMTPEEKKILQEMVDETYQQFFTTVRDGRHLKDEALRPLADGRVYCGSFAMRAGLIDKLGGMRVAADTVGELAGLGKNPKILRTTSESWDNFINALDSKFGGDLLSITKLQQAASPKLSYLWVY